MSTATIKLFFAFSILFVILLAGWFPFKNKLLRGQQDFAIGETLATGIFLGAGLLHMLPDANSMFHKLGYNYPYAYLITGIIFLLFLWFEHLGKELYHEHHIHRFKHNDEMQDVFKSGEKNPAFVIVAWLMLSIHSFVLGTALGFTYDYPIMFMLFVAIITHKWAESFAIAIQLNASKLAISTSSLLFLSFALMSPLGIYCGYYFGKGIEVHSIIEPILIAASAGTFLYLGTLHGLERCVMVERCCNLKYFSFVIIGFLIMAAVASYEL